LNRGIRVILSKGRDVPKVYKNKDDIFVGMNNVDSSNVEDLQFTLSKQHVLEKYLTDRLNGNILNSDFDTDNAYNNKKKWSLEKLLNYYGGDFKIDNEVAFIYLHALSDANHCSGKLLFRDYYSWFTETVAFIKNIKSVNWIIKPHPSSSVYNESGIVEDVLAQIGANNIFLSPNNISNKSVFKISKTVITVSGTIGIEAACFGLRPILAGVSNYSGFGFTIDCKTKEEYFENLTNLDNSLRPLCEKEILLAKKVMYLYHIGLDLNSDILLDDSCLIPGEDLKNDGLVDGIYGEVSNNLSKYKYEDDPFYKYVEKMVQAI